MADPDIKGLKELDRKMKKLPRDIAAKLLQKATTASAKVFVQPAKDAAPKDSGQMAQTIKARKTKTNSSYVAATGVRPRKGGGLDPYYWLFVELGTARQPAQPFLRSAFDGNAKAAGEEFKKVLSKGLKHVV